MSTNDFAGAYAGVVADEVGRVTSELAKIANNLARISRQLEYVAVGVTPEIKKVK